MHSVDVQRAAAVDFPTDAQLISWSRAALSSVETASALLIRLVDEDESRRLNQHYRHKDRPTNVLSFPTGLDQATTSLLAGVGEAIPLGDVVICAPVVREEAAEQRKSEQAHWAHMVVHGVLHLLGFDHQQAREAEEMESREREILAGLGFPDPYLSQ